MGFQSAQVAREINEKAEEMHQRKFQTGKEGS